MKILLHVCCGPCASACTEMLREVSSDVALFFSNCNLDTADEYARRLDAARTLASADDLPLIADTYDHAAWLDQVARGYETAPEKGARCARCFRFSLARTVRYAQAHGFDAVTTSLTVSPHKVSSLVFAAGKEAVWQESCAPCGGSSAPPVQFLPIDFKKKNGFLRSLKRSSQLNLYRQAYCGCEFSKK